MLYSYKNQYPQPLPYRIRLPDGTTRTDPTTFIDSEIISAGFIPVANPPTITPTQALSWDGSNWVVRDLNSNELEELATNYKQNLIKDIIENTQRRLDNFAKERGYDGILSACTYATDPELKFSIEGQRAVDVRSRTWKKLYEILAEVEAGTRTPPTSYLDIEPLLPPAAWLNP